MVMARNSAERMLSLEDRISDELAGMFVFQAVEHARSHLPGGDHSRQPKFGQMLGYCSRRFLDDVGEMIHRQLLIAQCENNADPGGIGKHGENLDRKLNVLTVDVGTAYLLICIHTQILTQSGA